MPFQHYLVTSRDFLKFHVVILSCVCQFHNEFRKCCIEIKICGVQTIYT